MNKCLIALAATAFCAAASAGHDVDRMEPRSPVEDLSIKGVPPRLGPHITPDPNGNGYYPVYTDIKRGHANYCAWHSAGTCGGVPVQFAFFFNLDGDAGCDPQDTQTGHSQGLAALVNVTGHELSEARSDP